MIFTLKSCSYMNNKIWTFWFYSHKNKLTKEEQDNGARPLKGTIGFKLKKGPAFNRARPLNGSKGPVFIPN